MIRLIVRKTRMKIKPDASGSAIKIYIQEKNNYFTQKYFDLCVANFLKFDMQIRNQICDY